MELRDRVGSAKGEKRKHKQHAIASLLITELLSLSDERQIYLYIHLVGSVAAPTRTQFAYLFVSFISRIYSDAVRCMRYILNYLIKTGICFRLCDFPLSSPYNVHRAEANEKKKAQRRIMFEWN